MPVSLAADEDRDTIDHGAAGGEDLLRVPLGGLLAAYRQVAYDDVGFCFFENANDVIRGTGGLLDDLGHVFADTIVGHATGYLDTGFLHVAEPDCIVGWRVDGISEILAHLVRVDVDGGHELYITDVVTAQVHMHKAGHLLAGLGFPVIGHALYERRGAISHADDGNSHGSAQGIFTSR